MSATAVSASKSEPAARATEAESLRSMLDEMVPDRTTRCNLPRAWPPYSAAFMAFSASYLGVSFLGLLGLGRIFRAYVPPRTLDPPKCGELAEAPIFAALENAHRKLDLRLVAVLAGVRDLEPHEFEHARRLPER